ncbi:MAG: hypothetical protein N4A45_06485 [Flavobacteriales bacterium]|jgi:hypothetical protein|nr:hypothetical protein [Flavobacteriales bacterium]
MNFDSIFENIVIIFPQFASVDLSTWINLLIAVLTTIVAFMSYKVMKRQTALMEDSHRPELVLSDEYFMHLEKKHNKLEWLDDEGRYFFLELHNIGNGNAKKIKLWFEYEKLELDDFLKKIDKDKMLQTKIYKTELNDTEKLIITKALLGESSTEITLSKIHNNIEKLNGVRTSQVIPLRESRTVPMNKQILAYLSCVVQIASEISSDFPSFKIHVEYYNLYNTKFNISYCSEISYFKDGLTLSFNEINDVEKT